MYIHNTYIHNVSTCIFYSISIFNTFLINSLKFVYCSCCFTAPVAMPDNDSNLI